MWCSVVECSVVMVVVEYSQYAHFCSFFTRRTVPCTCHTKQHLNVQKGSVPPRFFYTFGHVLRAATGCTFSSLIWPDGSAPTALESLLFRPITLSRDILTSSRTWFFFLLTFSSLIFFLLLFSGSFHLSILTEVWLLNFHRFATVGLRQLLGNMSTVISILRLNLNCCQVFFVDYAINIP